MWKSVIPNETSVVQLADGHVMFYSRIESINYRRLITYSEDGATDWSTPYFHDAFCEPICFGAMVGYSMKPYQSKNRILFSNPDSLHDPWTAKRQSTPRSAKNRHYFLKRKEQLLECFRQPGSRIDNNLVENALRPLKLGLKNYLFVGHPDASSTFACLYTLVENCRPAGANPEEYLTDVIERLLDHPSSRLEEFIPQNWVELRKSKNDGQ